MSAPWKCPDCSAWLAPHVSEHRCTPPDAASPAVVSITPGSGSGTSAAILPAGTVVTYNVTGSAVSEQDIARTIQRGLMRLSANSARVRYGLPGAA